MKDTRGGGRYRQPPQPPPPPPPTPALALSETRSGAIRRRVWVRHPHTHTHGGFGRWVKVCFVGRAEKKKKQQQSAKHEQREEALWRLTALHCVIEVRKRIEKKANLVASEADHQNDDKTGYNTVTHTEPNPKMKQKNKTKKNKPNDRHWTGLKVTGETVREKKISDLGKRVALLRLWKPSPP